MPKIFDFVAQNSPKRPRFLKKCVLPPRISSSSNILISATLVLNVIVQAHDYRLGHIHASMAATLVLNVIPLRGLTAAVLLCKYKYLRNRTLHVIAQVHDYRLGHIHASMAATLVLNVIASEAKQSRNPDS